MSAKIFGLVWELELPREEKYVLLCLADHADHDGNNVYPSIGLIAWKTDYSERRIQELMRRLEHRKLLLRVGEQIGRGKTTVYRIDLAAGTFKEARGKGAKISPFYSRSENGKGEIPQGERVRAVAQKGEIPSDAIRKNRQESKTLNLHPPTPLKGGSLSTTWQKVCEYLKDDLSDAYVKNPLFQELAYDKYFRDAWLVDIKGGVAILDGSEAELLREGVEKFQRRLRDTFRAVVSEVCVIKVAKSPAWADAS